MTKWPRQRNENRRKPAHVIAVGILTFCFFPLLVLPAQSVTEAPDPVELFETAAEKLTYGRERFDRTALEEAIDYSRRALEGNPQYTAAHLVSAEANMWLENYDRAGVHLEAAARYGGRTAERALLAARLSVLQGRFDEAEREYGDILRRQPYNEDARVGRALLDIVGGAPDIATSELRRLQQRFPENRQLLLALIRLSIERDDEGAVTRYLQLALRYHGESATVQLMAAQAALEKGDTAAAFFHGKNTVAIAPNLEDGWLLLAEAARHSGNLREAVTYYETLLRIDPNNHRAWYARGALAARTGDHATAIQSWNRAREIRPDFELPLLAQEHHAINNFPLEAEERAALADPYHEIGARLEDRFLFRQAEQAYRRGLQIYPYDTRIRRALAELYRNRDMRGRYVRELEIIEELGGADREIRDLIEAFRAVRIDSVATVWEIDQFTADRPRTNVAIVYRDATGATDPGAGLELARYLRSLLLSSQDIDADAPIEVETPGRVATVSAGRGVAADLIVGVEFRLLDRRVVAQYALYADTSVIPLAAGTIARSGNDRVRNAIRELSARVEDHVPSRGYVLRRDFDRVLISLGSVDGVETDHLVAMYGGSEGAHLGDAPVVATDDLVSVVTWDPDGPDNLGHGDIAELIGEPEEPDETDDADSDPEETDPESQTEISAPSFSDLVQELFRMR